MRWRSKITADTEYILVNGNWARLSPPNDKPGTVTARQFIDLANYCSTGNISRDYHSIAVYNRIQEKLQASYAVLIAANFIAEMDL